MIYQQKPEIRGSKLYTGGAIGFSGPPGTGKSTIGKIIAEKLEISFYDLDDLIFKKAGVPRKYPLISNKGKNYFKQIQHSCFKDVFQKNDQSYILSFGGHIINKNCDSSLITQNQSLVQKHLFNICLIPSDDINEVVDVLWTRQYDGKRETGCNNSNQYRQYVQDLIPQYIKLADKVVFTHNSSINDTIEIILKEILTTKK